MVRISSKHKVTLTRMELLYVGGMTTEGEEDVMSSTRIERSEKNDSRS